MEENYNNMTIARLRALAREHGLQGYSRLRKADLITFLRENLHAQEPVENHQPVGRTHARPLRRSKSLELPRETTFNSIRRSKSLELPLKLLSILYVVQNHLNFRVKLLSILYVVRDHLSSNLH